MLHPMGWDADCMHGGGAILYLSFSLVVVTVMCWLECYGFSRLHGSHVGAYWWRRSVNFRC